MMPLVVTCDLANGLAMRDPWSPTLDGVLAYALMRERLDPETFAAQAASPSSLLPVEGLPLERVQGSRRWWWAASSPTIVGEQQRQRRHFHRRFDDHAERHLAEGVRKVMTAAGPYKTSRLSDVHVSCRALRWSVIGEPIEIARLLSTVTQLGRRRSVGYGVVLGWRVEEGHEDDVAAARWRRPVPLEDALDISGRQVMSWGLAPPHYAPACQAECVMP